MPLTKISRSAGLWFLSSEDLGATHRTTKPRSKGTETHKATVAAFIVGAPDPRRGEDYDYEAFGPGAAVGSGWSGKGCHRCQNDTLSSRNKGLLEGLRLSLSFWHLRTAPLPPQARSCSFKILRERPGHLRTRMFTGLHMGNSPATVRPFGSYFDVLMVAELPLPAA